MLMDHLAWYVVSYHIFKDKGEIGGSVNYVVQSNNVRMFESLQERGCDERWEGGREEGGRDDKGWRKEGGRKERGRK